jgi:hypothetical protein
MDNDKRVHMAIAKGDILTLQRLLEGGHSFCPTDVEHAARTGNMKLLHWFRTHSADAASMKRLEASPGTRNNRNTKQKTVWIANAIPWSVDCASRGAMEAAATSPQSARNMLTYLQRPVTSLNGLASAPPLHLSRDVDSCFRWNLVRHQLRAPWMHVDSHGRPIPIPSILQIPSRM